MAAAVVALVVALPPNTALAANKFNSPLLDNGDGSVSCTNCCTGSSLTTGSLLVGGGSSAISALANNGTSTVMYMTNASGINSGNPGWRAPLLGDITTAAASSVLAGILNDETGGTSKAVFDTNPTINGLTLTGSQAWGSATAPFTFPAGAINNIADIGSTPKKGTANVTKLVTTTSAAVTNNNCAKWDNDGNLVDSGGTCGGSGLSSIVHDVSPMTQLTVLSATPIFCGMDGSCSTTTNGTDVQTPIKGTGTFDNINCQATSGTTNAVTVEMFAGTCNNALSTGTAKVIMSATAWTAGTISGSTGFTDGQCVVFKYTAGTNAAKAIFRCSVKQSAGT